MWIARKLEDVFQSLTPPEDQGKVLEFLTNAENAQRINGLVEDVCEALMEYQVCRLDYSSPLCLTFMLDIFTKRYPQ